MHKRSLIFLAIILLLPCIRSQNILKKKIKIISNGETKKYLNKAGKISPDNKDVDYFALALRLNCVIWSNDKKLKEQNKVKIYSTEELVKEFS